MTQEEGSGNEDFVDKYLHHLERRDSREGATKWLMMAAMATLLWQLSKLIFESKFQIIGQLVAIFLVLYFVVEFTFIISSKGENATSLRFKTRTGYKGESGITAFSVRCIISGAMVIIFFSKVTDIYKWLAGGPSLFFGTAILVVTIGHLRKKYEVLKPKKNKNELKGNVVALVIFVFPTIFGLYKIFNDINIKSIFLDSKNLSSIQAAGLLIVILFIAEKYARTLRVDGEVAAVRRIWLRKGVGEISVADASKDLRLIIAGASLNEVISNDVNGFSKRLQVLEEQEELMNQELEKFLEIDSTSEPLIKSAMRNSLQKRASDISEALKSIESRREDIISNVKSIIDDAELSDAETKELESSLSERCKSRRISIESLLDRIRQASIPITSKQRLD